MAQHSDCHLLVCQDASAPAEAAKIKKMLDGFKIPAAGEVPMGQF
jgi:hypothetical protein